MDTFGGDSNKQPQQADDKNQRVGQTSQSQAAGQDTGQAAGQPAPQPQVQPEPQAGRGVGAKEAEFVSQTGAQEQVKVVEMREPGELPVEVAGYIERAEKDDVAEPKTVVHEGQTIVSSAQPQNVSVTLPLDDEGIKKGLKHKFSESVRWLAAWVERIKKIFKE